MIKRRFTRFPDVFRDRFCQQGNRLTCLLAEQINIEKIKKPKDIEDRVPV